MVASFGQMTEAGPGPGDGKKNILSQDGGPPDISWFINHYNSQ